MDDFKLLLGTSESRLSPENAERLANACLVVNALGPKVRGARRTAPCGTSVQARPAAGRCSVCCCGQLCPP